MEGEVERVRRAMLSRALVLHRGDLVAGSALWVLTQFVPQLCAAAGIGTTWPRVVLAAATLVLVARGVGRVRTGMLRKGLRPQWTWPGILATVVGTALLLGTAEPLPWPLRLVCALAFAGWVTVRLPQAVDAHVQQCLDLMTLATRASGGHRAPWHGIEVAAVCDPALAAPAHLLLCVGLEATSDAHLPFVADVVGLSSHAAELASEHLAAAGLVEVQDKPVGPNPRTWAGLTDLGRAVLVGHLEALDASRPSRA